MPNNLKFISSLIQWSIHLRAQWPQKRRWAPCQHPLLFSR